MKVSSDQLVAFSVVAELGSVSRAAEKLNLSQPTVSSQLRALQDQFGEPLYRRKAHGVSLTPAGENLLPYAHAVARSLRQVSDHIAGVQERPERVLRLGLAYSLGRRAYDLVTDAAAQRLQLQLLVGDSSTLAGAVMSGHLDAALILGPVSVPTDKLDTQPMGEDELVVALPAKHPLADLRYTPLNTLEDETFLWAVRTSSVRRQSERLLQEAGITPKSLELGSLIGVREALLDGHGVALLPREFVQRERDLGLIATLGIEAPLVGITQLLVTPPTATQGPEHRALTAFLREAGRQSKLH
ncbi:LysR family transcriptional regulator [Deinococcus radiophilus]|uniref:LysR family transcriptional regulator n=1 Tax=Deinococcus radiophilus TaxID=32062 RepID=A0A431VPR2_9DEIO|nr:LysR family transcriptional regulator [Deinococcus radiophilus]RTR24707.1 LysR family transcriptional regulator [Deinococcus radiophilus]UFA51636.1 LysR family transcriptional regulator [Deinococcus radiophilus]